MLSHVALLKVHEINPLLNSEITAAVAVAAEERVDLHKFLEHFKSFRG
jgi:hypothetical protein